MSKLFETTTLKGLQLDNRFVRSATWLGMAGDDGSSTPRLIDSMAELAQGGVGLIVTGHAYVLKGGQAGPWQMACHDDRLLPGLTEMAKAVHEANGKIALQIAHAGILASSELSGEEPLGPSPMQTETGPVGRAMTVGEIERTADGFAAAACRAVQAGFDGVQIHAAHGFLLSQFLSPYFNRRADEYGGSVHNRARALLRVVGAIQDAVGDGYPVFVKMNSEDLLDGGLSVEDMVQVCTMLEQADVDAIELSGGTALGVAMNKLEISFCPVGNGRVYYREAAKKYKAEVSVPLMLVGGIQSLETADKLVADGVADYVALCRPLVREPDLVNRWRSGDRRKADCLRDNLCGWAGFEGNGVRCAHLVQADAPQ
jgi:2,4-dienoyl-CoA reductase-like NADH-dependent reductase (Old Yellow Enzyme family)